MNFIVIDRTNLDDVIIFDPSTKRNITRGEDLAECVAKHGHWVGRTDILLVNGRTKQFAIYPTANGGLTGDLIALEFIDQATYDRVIDIAKRTAELAKRNPIAKWLVV